MSPILKYMIEIVIAAILIIAAAAWFHQWMIARGILRRCPLCRSVIDGKATVCRACHREIPA